jgi:hypothetical protein
VSGVDAAANTWLELRYGLRPLVSLVQDVIDRVSEKRADILDPSKIRTAKSQLMFRFFDKNIAEHTVGSYYRFLATSDVEDTIKVNASVQYKQTALPGTLDSLGLTPRFLPEVAWELTRLSYW